MNALQTDKKMPCVPLITEQPATGYGLVMSLYLEDLITRIKTWLISLISTLRVESTYPLNQTRTAFKLEIFSVIFN